MTLLFTDHLSQEERITFSIACRSHMAFFQQTNRSARIADLRALLIRLGLNFDPKTFPLHELSDKQIDIFIEICSHPFTFTREIDIRINC
jgi:hypothetical protein